MHVLLMILKVLGIVFLVLIGVFVLLVCAVLFMSVHYQVTGELFEEKNFYIHGNWFGVVLCAVCEIKGKSVTAKVRCFGLTVFSYPPVERLARQKRRLRHTKKKEVQISASNRSETGIQQEREIEEELHHIEQSSMKTEVSQPQKEKSKKAGKKKKILWNIREWILAIPQKLKQLGKNLAHIKEMLYDESNKAAVTHGLREIRYLLRHFGPRKLQTDIKFSMGDPAFTGQLLGIICIFPIVYQNDIHLVPDFESDSAYARGTFRMMGHVRLIHVLCAGFRILKDKNIHKLIRK